MQTHDARRSARPNQIPPSESDTAVSDRLERRLAVLAMVDAFANATDNEVCDRLAIAIGDHDIDELLVETATLCWSLIEQLSETVDGDPEYLMDVMRRRLVETG